MPAHNSPYSIFAFVIIVVKRSHQHLQRSVHIYQRGRYGIHNCLEKWLKADTFVVWMVHGDAVSSNGIEDREIEVRIPCRQFQKEILCPFEYLVDARIPAINFVDNDNGLQVEFQRLL